jgi:hypothetical protein
MATDTNKEVWMVGLCVACPHGQELANCPMKDIRSEALQKRIHLIRALSEEQIEGHLIYHEQCSQSRSKL